MLRVLYEGARRLCVSFGLDIMRLFDHFIVLFPCSIGDMVVNQRRVGVHLIVASIHGHFLCFHLCHRHNRPQLRVSLSSGHSFPPAAAFFLAHVTQFHETFLSLAIETGALSLHTAKIEEFIQQKIQNRIKRALLFFLIYVLEKHFSFKIY